MPKGEKRAVGVYRKAGLKARNRPPFVAGMVVLTLTSFIVFSIAVAAWTSVPEVTRAPGEISPTDDFRQIEAPEVGTVVTVEVREGDQVAAGQVLATLSSSDLSRQMAAVEEELAALRMRKANHAYILAALDQDRLSPDPAPTKDGDLEFAKSTLRVLRAQQQSDRNVIERLAANAEDQRRRLARLADRQAEKSEQVSDAQALFDKGLTTKATVEASKDALSRIEDQIHALEISLSSNLKDIEVLQTKLIRDRLELREKHVEETFDIAERRELKETEWRTLSRRQSALQIIAPTDGRIHSVGFPNEGEIIERGETLFELLPTGEALVAILRLPTRDIGHIASGMEVKLRLETFDARSTLPLEGRIVSISPNRVLDRDLGEDYFRATVHLMTENAAFTAIQDRLSAGMVVTAEVVTRERSMLAYILKPIERSISLAFSER